MDMVSVSSSNLSAVGYDEDSALLQIEFKSGVVYEYYDVPKYEYEGLMAADSLGKYADQNIYKHYRQSKIR
ncbi:MAG: KTSC domain-containing protein [Candidatus Margulisbacteria bacterium]|nr:KTSC domain-containing protein [Candidatus Margulisiibacteriota bacterium]